MLCRFVKQDSNTLLYSFTNKTNPALMLSLLGTGFHDVFSPPLNYDIIVARINTSIAALEKQEELSQKKKGFNGTFVDLPFVDLIQALSLSQRSVLIKLERDSGEQTDVYLRDGQMSCASCGKLTGDNAIHRIISWREDGYFRLEPVSEYPPDNIALPNDYVLMEGCRLVDEEAA